MSVSGAEELFKLLDQLHISYKILAHEPLFTTEQATEVSRLIPGAHPKNLFLYDKKNPDNLFLLSMVDTKRLDVNSFAKMLGVTGLSFAKPDVLQRYLGVTPGSVTPYGLLNDTAGQVAYYLDRDVVAHDDISFHPLRNDYTITISMKDFLRFCTQVNHRPTFVEVPTKA